MAEFQDFEVVHFLNKFRKRSSYKTVNIYYCYFSFYINRN